MVDLQDIALKVVSERAFAEKLLKEPEAALRSLGVEPTAEMLDVIKDLDVEALLALADDFRQGKAAF